MSQIAYRTNDCKANLMIQHFQQINRQWVVVFAITLSIAGFFFSRVLVSIGMIILVANAVIHPRVLDNLRAFVRSPVYISITVIFFIVLLSGLYSSDLSYWLARLRVKSAFLFLPVAFAFLKPLSKRQFYITLYILFGFVFISAIGVTIYYLANFTELSNAYLEAKVLPTPFNHIRYSLMVAFCIAIGLHCYIRKNHLFKKQEPYVLLIFSFFLFLFLHLLAVRSGLLASYIVLIVYGAYLIVSRKRYGWGAVLILALIALPLIGYWTMPTLQNKIRYTMYSLEQYYKHGKVDNLSDSRRIQSLKVGCQTGMKQPLIGVGYGDIKREVKQLYRENMPNLPADERMLPHNQFVMTFAGTGLIGLFCFLWAVLYPVLTNRHYKEPLFLSFNLIVLSSFMTEATIEVQYGTAFYSLFLLLLLKQPAFGQRDYQDHL